MFKKTLIIFLCLLLIPQGIFAKTFIDTESTKHEAAIDLLSDIGLLTGENEEYFSPNNPVTRAEFTTIAVRTLGMQPMPGEPLFTDVPESHWAYDYITTGYRLGIINGVSETAFCPDDTVTYAQAMKIAVHLLKYDLHALSDGGYPSGYLVRAQILGINEGVGENMTRGDVARLFYNVIQAPLAVQTSYGDGSNGEFNVNKDTTIMTEYLNIYKFTGKLRANYFTQLDNELSPSRTQIVLDKQTFEVGETDISEYIGQELTVFARKIDDELTVVSFSATKRVKKLTVKGSQIMAKTTLSSFRYSSENNKQEYDEAILSSADFVYNGKPFTPQASDLKPENGQVTLIMNNGSAVDVVIIEDYTDYVVDFAVAEEECVYLKHNKDGKTKLDLANTSGKEFIFKDSAGKFLFPQDCKEWDILSCAESKTGDLTTIILHREILSGTINEEWNTKVVIEGNSYTFSPSFSDDYTLGENHIFYLNFLGAIVALGEKNERNFLYGYAVEANRTTGLSGQSLIRIFTEKGEFVTYVVADKMFVNGIKMDGNKLFSDNSSLSYIQQTEYNKLIRNNRFIEQLVRFELNEQNQIDSLYTAIGAAMIPSELRQETFTIDYSVASAMFLGHGAQSFDTQYIVEEDTIIFNIPDTYDESREKNYTIRNTSWVVHSQHYPNLTFYDVNETGTIGVMISKSNTAGRSPEMFDSKAVLVTGTGKGISPDGNICDTINILSAQGQPATIYNPENVQLFFRNHALTDITKEDQSLLENGRFLKETIPATALNPGDIIKYEEVDGIVKSMVCIFRAQSPLSQEYASQGGERKSLSATYDSYGAVYMYTTATAVSDTSYICTVQQPGNGFCTRAHKFGSTIVMLFDRENQTAKVGSTKDLRAGDTFFSSRFNTFQDLIVIYR